MDDKYQHNGCPESRKEAIEWATAELKAAVTPEIIAKVLGSIWDAAWEAGGEYWRDDE